MLGMLAWLGAQLSARLGARQRSTAGAAVHQQRTEALGLKTSRTAEGGTIAATEPVSRQQGAAA